MSGVQVTLFKALKSIRLDDDTATAVVDSVEEHVKIMVNDTNKRLEAKLDALMIAQNRQTTIISVILTIVGLTVAGAVAVGPVLARLAH